MQSTRTRAWLRVVLALLNLIAVAVMAALMCASAGCSAIEKLPEGAQLQTQTTGIKVSPQALDGTPLALGTHTTILALPQPADAGPNVSRSEVQAPFGVRIKSTVASGDVGEQLGAASGARELVRELINGTPDGAAGVSSGRADGEPGED